jgi:hypothetical protein
MAEVIADRVNEDMEKGIIANGMMNHILISIY